MGRPSLYTDAIADEICRRLAEGEALREICRSEGYPSEAAVRSWAIDDLHGFGARYARAREIGYDVIAEGILELADTALIGTKSVSKPTGVETTEGDNVDRSRLQIDARKWLLSKMLPKKYGDKLELAGDKTSPLVVQVVRLTDADDPPASG